MSSAKKRTFNLPVEQSRYINTLVVSGTYATPNDVVDAGLHALQEREATVQHWLRESVAPVYDAMQADPDRAIPLDKVARTLHAHHADRLRAARRGA
jgi:antitoxin ParD1/3/4